MGKKNAVIAREEFHWQKGKNIWEELRWQKELFQQISRNVNTVTVREEGNHCYSRGRNFAGREGIDLSDLPESQIWQEVIL